MYRFGVFEFDTDRLELSRDGRPVHLQPQPAQVLRALVINAGRTVTRDELRQAVWGDDTFVDFDRGLNFCIAQIRTALADDAATPRYIRTVPKKGYEFVAPLSRAHEGGVPERSRWRAVAIAAALVAAAFVAYRAVARSRLPIVAVVRFDNETGDVSLSRFADNLTDNVTAQLTTAGDGRLRVVGNAAVLRGPRQQRDLRIIASALHAGFIVLGQVQRDEQRVRVLAHLIRMPDQTHVKVSRTDDVDVGGGRADPPLAVGDAIAGRIARDFSRAAATH
jgi:DNA-binding winged helix-turn-helix (wHTH) protein/TolB-like protein